MKKITLLFMLLVGLTMSAQSAKEMLAEIEGKWELDDNNNVTFVKIIEAPGLSKEEIYSRALNYFTYNYVNGSSVIQQQDKDLGIIVGKGLYNDVHVGVSLIATYISAWHILRVDVKEGRARAIITLSQYEKKVVGGNTASYSTVDISATYPIYKRGAQKTVMAKAFYKTVLKSHNTLELLEKAILEGSTSQIIENSEW